ncbi:3-hydroxyacyl-CoA dehydrogenase family protein [Roseiterribacter gracilis]|uniref:L-gulonate 3-dehydrogenase n=1 Tax=Roseiterribacter gracilis TaxID=2812848 RepID=A0A8S8XCJ6_9PROT|nr:3-hydroxybutyryl-CoA dehydrogenase [Rhodospirillales bacterium TMPK1]
MRGFVIVGCGLMGCDIAAQFLRAGWKVQGVAPEQSGWEATRERVQKSVAQLDPSASANEFTLRASVADIDWTGVELVIEAIPEKFELKAQLFEELDRAAPAGVPLATNTSGMRITEIAKNCKSANRMGGLHFFLPAHLVPAVEVVRGERTDDATMHAMYAIMKAVGWIPIRVEKDVPGFLANRLQHALMREAYAILDEGLATPEDVDAAVRYGFGFRYIAAGPILQKDLAGLETNYRAGVSIYPHLNNGNKPGRSIESLVEQGHYGTKTGKGFWTWTKEDASTQRAAYESTLIEAAGLLAKGARAPTR